LIREILSPIRRCRIYISIIDSNRSGSFFYEPVDVFSICEVHPGGIQEEKYAIFDGNGRQITNAKYNADWYTAWLPSMVGVNEYMDNEGNIYSPMEYDYNFRGVHGWELHIVPGDPYYYIFTAPSGKKIICKAENKKENVFRYGIIANELLVISTHDFVIAYLSYAALFMNSKDCKLSMLPKDGKHFLKITIKK